MSLRKAAAVLPLLAALACAAPSIKPTPIDKRQTDVCNGAGGRSDAYDYNIPLDNGSGNVYYLCYNTAGGVTLTQEVADDTVTILQEMVNGGACCVDCIPNAQVTGCTGNGGVVYLDECGLDGGDAGIEFAQPDVDAFRDLLNQAVPQNIQFGDGSDDKGLAPVLTFSTPDNPAGITPINLFTSGSPGDGHC